MAVCLFVCVCVCVVSYSVVAKNISKIAYLPMSVTITLYSVSQSINQSINQSSNQAAYTATVSKTGFLDVQFLSQFAIACTNHIGIMFNSFTDIRPVPSIHKSFSVVKNKETRNAWQSLAYSPLGAIVSPHSEYL